MACLLCVFIGSVVFVAGAFSVQGGGIGKVFGVNTLDRKGEEDLPRNGTAAPTLTIRPHGAIFAPSTTMTDPI
ncbi:MAG: hypothetical protein RR971_04780 [Alistipes sp.]